MPSVSDKQRRFMAAAANNPKFAKRVGIPQNVAREYHLADKKAKGGKISNLEKLKKEIRKDSWLHGSSTRDPRKRLKTVSGAPIFPEAIHVTREPEWAEKFARMSGSGAIEFSDALPPIEKLPKAKVWEFDVNTENPFHGGLVRYEPEEIRTLLEGAYQDYGELLENLLRKYSKKPTTGENLIKILSADPRWNRKEHGLEYLSRLPRSYIADRDTQIAQKNLKKLGYDSTLYRDFNVVDEELPSYIPSLAVFDPKILVEKKAEGGKVDTFDSLNNAESIVNDSRNRLLSLRTNMAQEGSARAVKRIEEKISDLESQSNDDEKIQSAIEILKNIISSEHNSEELKMAKGGKLKNLKRILHDFTFHREDVKDFNNPQFDESEILRQFGDILEHYGFSPEEQLKFARVIDETPQLLDIEKIPNEGSYGWWRTTLEGPEDLVTKLQNLINSKLSQEKN